MNGEAVMDFPAAWAFVRETNREDHHPDCSWRLTVGMLLCDCRVLWDEYDRRRAARLASQPRTSSSEPDRAP